MSWQPRVVIVDDHELVRSGVRSSLGDAVHVVGEAADIAEAVEVILDTEPDVVLLDVHLPSGTGGDVITQVTAEGNEAKFLALSVSDAADDVIGVCLLYTSPSPRDATLSRMPSSA